MTANPPTGASEASRGVMGKLQARHLADHVLFECAWDVWRDL